MTPSPQGPSPKSHTGLIIVIAVGVVSLLCCLATFLIAIPNFFVRY